MVRRLWPALGCGCKPANHLLEDGTEVPILCAVGSTGGNANAPRLLVLGVCDPHGEGEDPLTLKPHRLQFEARPMLDYAPLNAEAYRRGYGLERLRDLEMARLTTEESRNGHHLQLASSSCSASSATASTRKRTCCNAPATASRTAACSAWA